MKASGAPSAAAFLEFLRFEVRQWPGCHLKNEVNFTEVLHMVSIPSIGENRIMFFLHLWLIIFQDVYIDVRPVDY